VGFIAYSFTGFAEAKGSAMSTKDQD